MCACARVVNIGELYRIKAYNVCKEFQSIDIKNCKAKNISPKTIFLLTEA